MNAAHIHLLLNHIPVIGLPFAALLLIAGLAKRSPALRNAALTAFATLALLTLPVYLTGEPAQKIVEHLPGVTEAAIEEHEDAALAALIAIEVLGVLSVVTLVLLDRAPHAAQRLVFICLAIAVVTTGIMAWTANLGGRVRHTEIRNGTPPV
jgi:uncharacterized membrane protein